MMEAAQMERRFVKIERQYGARAGAEERQRIARRTAEEWRAVVGYQGFYEVSSEGRVRRLPSKRLRKAVPDRQGYLHIALSRGGVSRMWLVHQLVARAFHGPPPSRWHELNHKNGITSLNTPRNLAWVTRSANVLHAYRALGKVPPRGELHGRAKLTDADVRAIRASEGILQRVLARTYGVHQTRISAIRNRRAWRHVS